MAAEIVVPSVECFPINVPSSCFQWKTNYEQSTISDESFSFGLGPNTVVINENTSNGLKFNPNEVCGALWAVLKFKLKFRETSIKDNTFISKRLVQIIVNHQVSNGTIVVGEDFLFNLEYKSGFRTSSGVSSTEKYTLVLTNEEQCPGVPSKATKAVLSIIQSEMKLENSFVDKILQTYFSYPRYLCKEDVFSVPISYYHKLGQVNITDITAVYFKACDIEGPVISSNGLSDDICKGYFVDSTITILQIPNHQDLYPPKILSDFNTRHLSSLLDDENFIEKLKSRYHNLIPPCFDETFKMLCSWLKPFLCRFKQIEDIELNPVFLISGQNGSGKTLLLKALSDYFGINYWREDCVLLNDAAPGQAEAKLKVIFNQLKNVSPCVLHLSNIEVLFQDADGKDDIRVLSCFEQQVKSLKLKCPVMIIASTNNTKLFSSAINRLFLDSLMINTPSYEDREDIISWLIHCNGATIDTQILQAVAAQTSGFAFRDLEVLVRFAFKENFRRSKEEKSKHEEFVFTDFSKTIGTMRKAFSDSIGAPKVPSVSWKDVGGLETLKKEILRSLRSNMFNTGLKRSGLLLHGPPGTGKTLLAKAVATQCGRNFLSVKGPELLNMYVGQSEQNVRDLFALAKAASPCIVFFDELDSIAPNRGRSGDSGGVMDRVVSQLLAEMDSLNLSGDVFILGATNRPDLIDPALLRPGRLDKLLYVGPCEDRTSQLSVLTALTHKLTLGPNVDLETIVSSLPTSVSGAQLSALCSAAWLSSARQTIQSGEHKHNPIVAVDQNHFLDALQSVFSQC